MKAILHALREGARGLARAWGLAVLLLAVNLFLAALLAVPLASRLEQELSHTGAAYGMLYGFDHGWWSEWSQREHGYAGTLGPEVGGIGFALRNLDLLLKGHLPAGVFETARPEAARAQANGNDDERASLGPVILALGVVYLLIQAFLVGGVLAVLRGRQAGWTLRALLHGSGFYFGRMLRVSALALLVDGLLFRLDAPFASWVQERAREAVSETTATAWLLGGHALLLLALLAVHLVSGYAKVIVVLEERSSALLALLSATSFCLRHALRAGGHYLVLVLLGLLLLGGWGVLQASFDVVGYRTQLVALALGQGYLLGRTALRVVLMGGQIALFRTLGTS